MLPTTASQAEHDPRTCSEHHRWDFHGWLRRIYPPDGIRPAPGAPEAKKVRSVGGKLSYAPMAARVRAQERIPLSDEHLEVLVASLTPLPIGTGIEVVVMTEKSHRTVRGRLAALDDETLTIERKERFYGVPLRSVFYALTANIES